MPNEEIVQTRRHICTECLRMRTCIECGKLVEHPHIGFDKTYCYDCWSEQYFFCPDCQKVYTIEDRRIGTGEKACCPTCWSKLYFECDQCREVYPVSETHTGPDGKTMYCPVCYSQLFISCEYCRKPIREST
jgi:hypothetical protein